LTPSHAHAEDGAGHHHHRVELFGIILVEQICLFALLGIANTVVDFAIYNLLARPPFGWSRIPANIVSTSVAMTFSFCMNLRFVFPVIGGDVLTRSFKFLAVTAFSLYVVQNSVILVATRRGIVPVRLIQKMLVSAGLGRRLSDDFIERNGVKLLAVCFGLIWNFSWYKYYVFAWESRMSADLLREFIILSF
jgi:putative flippase GtrA